MNITVNPLSIVMPPISYKNIPYGYPIDQEREARIRKHLLKPEFLPSSYDMAWVAMVPLPGSVQAPCFPQCLEWILQKQHGNGSWGVNACDSSAKTNRDVLLSTLACIIALKKWNVGHEKIRGGMHVRRQFIHQSKCCCNLLYHLMTWK
jgi:hypothetical protein